MARRRSRERDETGAITDEVVLGILRQLQSLDQRLTRVEELLAETELDRLAQAEHADLIDLRLHSARLAAELSRVTVDLQARIDALANRRAATDEPTPGLDRAGGLGAGELPAPIDTERSPGWEPLPDE